MGRFRPDWSQLVGRYGRLASSLREDAHRSSGSIRCGAFEPATGSYSSDSRGARTEAGRRREIPRPWAGARSRKARSKDCYLNPRCPAIAEFRPQGRRSRHSRRTRLTVAPMRGPEAPMAWSPGWSKQSATCLQWPLSRPAYLLILKLPAPRSPADRYRVPSRRCAAVARRRLAAPGAEAAGWWRPSLR